MTTCKRARAAGIRPLFVWTLGMLLGVACTATPPPEPRPSTPPSSVGPDQDDSDRDGVLGDADKCPADPEDQDKIDDSDGCPEDDADKDGIADIADACPKEPGHASADRMTAGCPHLVRIESSSLMIIVEPSTALRNTEQYAHNPEADFVSVADDPRSTFSVDVDTASYSNVRRFLKEGNIPPPDAVRTEELINYFRYDYPRPTGTTPFSVTTEVASCPWAPTHRLVSIGIRGKAIGKGAVPPRNLVFLVDVSGSMGVPNKLPLLVASMQLLVDELTAKDTVSIVVYAGAAGLVLPATRGDEKDTIREALSRLSAGGSTAGGAGINLAYSVAEEAFIKNGENRVILATDGDFNVGTSDVGSLTRLVEEKKKSGVRLSVLGFGMGNLKDQTLEKLADNGDGNYAYIDSLAEARKVLVEQAGATLVTIAKDVKLQVEFNPKQVASYRLIGYENRKLAHEDFKNDAKDAGDIGAGHDVTALYEIVPASIGGQKKVDPLKYQTPTKASSAAASGEMLTLKLRYKPPAESTSKELVFAVKDGGQSIGDASNNVRFASAVAAFGMLLRDSKHLGKFTYADTKKLASGALGADVGGYRAGFIPMIDSAAKLASANKTVQP